MLLANNLYSQNTTNVNFILEKATSALATKDYSEAYFWLDRGQKLFYENSKFKQEIDKLNKMFEENPNTKSTLIEDVIVEAEKYFSSKNYPSAKHSYFKALALDPSSQFVKDRIEKVIQNYKDPEDQAFYNAMITAGDKLGNEYKYDEAIVSYEKAFVVKPNDRELRYKIETAKTEKEKYLKQKAEADKYLASGDKFLEENKRPQAKEQYQRALDIFPNDKKIQNKIYEIDNYLTIQQNKQTQFDALIESADEFYLNRDFSSAVLKYSEALTVKPEARYAQEMLEKAKKGAIEQQGELDIYNAAVANADKLLNQKEYQGALTAFQTALKLKPNENYPKTKISEIENILSKLASDKQNFEEAIANADKHFDKREWQQAINSYQAALKVKPEDEHSKTRIAQINNIITEEKNLETSYANAIKEADSKFNASKFQESIALYTKASEIKPSETYPKEQIAIAEKNIKDAATLEQQYAEAIKSGDDKLAKAEYSSAIASFVRATELKPNETYPKEKIKEINNIISEKESKDLAYSQAIISGDNFFKQKKWQDAITSYTDAVNIKSGEKYPKEQIAKAQSFIADNQKLESEYQAALDIADKLFGENKFAESIEKYNVAKALKPEETYPQEQILLANNKIQEIKDLEASYSKYIKEGDGFYSQKKYSEALNSFTQASNLKPAEDYPKTKITEITALVDAIAKEENAYRTAIELADKYFDEQKYHEAIEPYQRALTIRANDSHAKTRLETINQIVAKIAKDEADFNGVFEKAVVKLESKSYNEAKTLFETALNIKPNSAEAKEKLDFTISKIKEIEATELAYNNAVTAANTLIAENNFAEAITYLNKAHEIKLEEAYPVQKAEELKSLIADKEKDFNNRIADADKAFKEERYPDAINFYKNALKVKPDNDYSKNQIAKIETIIAQKAEAINKLYQQHIADADKSMENKDYNSAIEYYTEAQTVKPEQDYPKQQIALAQSKIKEMEAARSAEYNQALAKADNLYKTKVFDQAIDAYLAAKLLMPTDNYPDLQIGKIKKYLDDHAIQELSKTVVVIDEGKDIKYDFSVIEPRLRRNNYIVLKAKSVGGAQPRVFLNYGKNNTKNGGIVVRTTENSDVNDYLIRISDQDRWYREDNNWISIVVEAGKLEIHKVQIATAD